MGESGAGKTTSCKNLDPNTTYYIDADGKGLSWKGWRNQYNKANKNYIRTTNVDKIIKTINGISQARPHIKVIVIDTINGIMVADEMARAKEKGYDKWVDLAQCIWDLVDCAHKLRDDLTLVFMAHSQTEISDYGHEWTRIKTSGRKLEKIVLESKFTSVLLAKCVSGQYIFETQSNNSTAKTPHEAFDTLTIENDIAKVIKALEEF